MVLGSRVHSALENYFISLDLDSNWLLVDLRRSSKSLLNAALKIRRYHPRFDFDQVRNASNAGEIPDGIFRQGLLVFVIDSPRQGDPSVIDFKLDFLVRNTSVPL